MKFILAFSILVFSAGAVQSDTKSTIGAYATCMEQMINTNNFIAWMAHRNEALPTVEVAAFQADLDHFVAMGVRRFGSAAVSTLVSNPDTAKEDAFAKASAVLYETDGAVATFSVLARAVAPCGGPRGQLLAFYPG